MNDLISRQAVLRCIKESREDIDWGQSEDGDAFLHYSAALYRTIASEECLPPAQPEEFEWCHDCKEYDQQVHCCHRWTKVIRNTVKELKTERKNGKWIKQSPATDTEECSECGYNILEEEFETPFCPWCGADMRGDTE
jgi:hypothetical protein